MSTETQAHIELTVEAADVFKKSCLSEDRKLEDSRLRVGANSGGCSGYRYELEWDDADNVSEDDVSFQSNGVHIVVNRECLTTVLGSVRIAYNSSNLVEQGFVFQRLDHQHQCGCGESFTALKDMETA